MNVAKAASGPQEQREMFHNAGLPVRDRLVLHFLFEGNDLQDSAAYRRRVTGQEPRQTLADRSFTMNVFWWLARTTQPRVARADEHRGRINGEDYYFSYSEEQFRGVTPEFVHLRQTLDQFRTEVVGGGGAYVVVIVPTKLRVLGPISVWPPDAILGNDPKHLSPLRDLLHQWADEADVPVCDLSDALARSAADGELPWFPADSHLNEIGHRIIGDVVAASIPMHQFQARIPASQ